MAAVYFPKEGRDKSYPASYHPICLLLAIRKVLDEMHAIRLANYLEANNAGSTAFVEIVLL